MITEVCEHNVDLSLLPEKANILDLGCRGFQFTNYFKDLGHTVYSVDIDELQGQSYYQCAITGYNGKAGILKTDDPQATRIMPGCDVTSYTLEKFMDFVGVEFFDLIKMDIEMAEYPVILSLSKAPAKQLSIEFHLHYGQYTQADMKIMEAKLRDLKYEFVSHKLTEEFGAGLNYWRSLFVLR